MNKQRRPKQFKQSSDTSIFWCLNCNVPLIEHSCAICGTKGKKIDLGLPGDVRFCSPHERAILHTLLISGFCVDPLGDRIILLNKIGGEDKTDQVIVDGLIFGILRYDLTKRSWRLDIQMDGAAVLTQHTSCTTIELAPSQGHLSGKTVTSTMILWCSDDVKAGDSVIVRSGKMVGVGSALLDAKDVTKSGAPAVRIRKIGKSQSKLNDTISIMEDVIRANEPAIKRLGKNAINTIRGIANQKEFRGRPVYVSFSGGKDSLAVLDLTRSALKQAPEVYFINTGLEFPDTVEYVRRFCSDNELALHEYDAGDMFWQHLPDFGPPAKDYRWCCKVCKLSPASEISEAGNYLTIDGKRRYESFTRARIAPKETNPLVPGQINVYPIRDWRAVEVWLYIHWRSLDYNPLYDKGFERIGCWLCPAALSAEYRQMETLHPKLYQKWDGYLHDWADVMGLSEEYIDHGFWRWREHPQKIKLLAEQLGIPLISKVAASETFQITVVSGISPCKAGGYSIEGSVKGIKLSDAAQMMKMMGDVHYSKDLGVLMVQTLDGSVKIYTDGTIQINASDKASAGKLFTAAAHQLIRSVKCTGCRICEKACPHSAIMVRDKHVRVNEKCDRCGRCDDVCVVTRYLDKMVPGLLPDNI